MASKVGLDDPAGLAILRLPSLHTFSAAIRPYINWQTSAVLLVSYLAVVRALRYRNLHRLRTKYAAYLAAPHTMDYATAHEILMTDMLAEFPFAWAFGTQWALVKSYGIANGTRLLVATRQLTEAANVGKRAEDTGVVLGEILVQGVDSERGRTALAKMNWLHRRYGAKISNGDMIHTLGLFVLEPHRWVDMYEWRPLTELERVATFVYWREIGSRMGMRGIPRTLAELEAWMVEYEKDNMYYTDDNKACVEATVDLFVRDMPGSMQAGVKKAMAAFIEPRVRPVLGLDDPPAWAEAAISRFFALRRVLTRYFLLPRFANPYNVRRDTNDGRLYRTSYMFEPWYVKDTWASWLVGKLGLSSKPLPGPGFKNKGFLPEELGPMQYEAASKNPVLREAEQLDEYARGGGSAGMGCPFAFKTT